MPSFKNRRRVRHGADAMFALVADVEAYPQFVPLCQELTVRSRNVGPDGREVLIANMRVGYKAIRESFLSEVSLDRAARRIVVRYLEGPFRRMENVWSFADDGATGGSFVDFSIDYEFRSRVLGALMGAMFDEAFRRFSAAFEARADKVYGVKPAT